MKDKQIAIFGNLFVLCLVLYPRALDIILSSGFLNTGCDGALIRPSFWLMANGIAQTILFSSAFMLITLYLVSGEIKLLYGHLTILSLTLSWFLLWSVLGILSFVFKSDSCASHEINYIMFVLILFNIGYELVWILVAMLVEWKMGLFGGYRNIADNTNTAPYSEL